MVIAQLRKQLGLAMHARLVAKTDPHIAFRKEIGETLRYLGSTPSLPETVPIVGYRVTHRGEGQLRYLFNEVFLEACYYFEHDSDAPRILDCGSNIGMSILFFKKLYPNARIVSFEPDPSTFEALQANVAQNGIQNVELNRIAVGAKDETRTFFRSPDGQTSDLTMSLLQQRLDGRRIDVDCRRLSSFIAGEIDLLKLDVEGAEQEVLAELAEADKLRLIKRMHLEYHHHIDRTADVLSQTLHLLEKQGFGYQIHASPGTKPWPSPSFQDVSLFCYRKAGIAS